MQDDIAIDIRNLTKRYILYKNPVERLKNILFRSENGDVFSALDGITLSVKRGESLGIIGENGAGKSTLLRILSNVLTPSEGSVVVNGRVLSILELGVGLHPEFSGRENIFFYGDILGFSRDFLRSKVDEIIDFSELDKFIDKPIKTYSSGMLMRLSFSIITSFNPDILILDEVLAVGDLHFQRKSLNRILEYKKNGMTILFCSHDTYHIRMLCDRVLWLKEGKEKLSGSADTVVSEYESYQMNKDEYTESIPQDSSLPVRISSVALLNGATVKSGEDMTFEIQTTAVNENTPYHIMFSVKLKDGRGVYVTGSHLAGREKLLGSKTVRIIFPNNQLLSGVFYGHARVFDETGLILYNEKVTGFFNMIKDTQEFGICFMENRWEID
ncbi:MAG: polysaccharide ABC transporter ATP-binding protein [Thermodesulfovibrionales bacterium]|nr:polysaccharide ABC transporter ATP-binding protein [Thermodesulfovibrionales bacterium]